MRIGAFNVRAHGLNNMVTETCGRSVCHQYQASGSRTGDTSGNDVGRIKIEFRVDELKPINGGA